MKYLIITEEKDLLNCSANKILSPRHHRLSQKIMNTYYLRDSELKQVEELIEEIDKIDMITGKEIIK
jgi:hypothetical protein